MKIAVFSSWLPEVSEQNKIIAREIVEYLAKMDSTIEVVTGGCSGIPALCIETAHKLGLKTTGYFPLQDQGEYFDRQHEENIHEVKFYSEVHFVSGFTARSLEMIQNVDAAIVLNGRIGTLSEFGIAVEEGLPLGVIEGTGGITDELQRLTKLVKKEFPKNDIIFDADYKKVIDFLVDHIEMKKKNQK